MKIQTVDELNAHFSPASQLATFLGEGKYYSMSFPDKGDKYYATLLKRNNEIGSSATLIRKIEIPAWLFFVAFNFNQDYILLSVLGPDGNNPIPENLHTSARADVNVSINWKGKN